MLNTLKTLHSRMVAEGVPQITTPVQLHDGKQGTLSINLDRSMLVLQYGTITVEYVLYHMVGRVMINNTLLGNIDRGVLYTKHPSAAEVKRYVTTIHEFSEYLKGV